MSTGAETAGQDGADAKANARALTGTIALLALAAFFSGAALRVCDSLLPRLAGDFEVLPGEAGGVIIGFAVAYGLMQLVFGPLGDCYGKTRLMCVALAGCTVAAGLSALAPNFTTLVGLRVVWGMFAAGIIPLAMAWIGDNVPYERRQATLATFLFGTLSGMTVGQFAGGLFGDSAAGWRGAFVSLAAGFAVVAVLLFMRVPHSRPTPIDGQAHPPLARQLQAVLRVCWARVVLLTTFVEGVCLLGPMSYLPSMLHRQAGISLSTASALIALYGVGGLLYAATARRIVAGLGEARMALCGGLLVGACFLAWWMQPPWWLSGPLALLLGFGTYLLHNTLQTHATQMAPSVRGTSVALFAFCLFTGQALGVSAAGWSVDRFGYSPMLWVAGFALPLAGWRFALALRQRVEYRH